MIKNKIAERLKFFRERSSLTIYEVGEQLGKSGKTVSAWENGRGQPDADMLLNLCSIYGISSIGELYGETPPTALSGFSPKLEELLGKYHKLNNVGKDYIETQIDFALSQQKYLASKPHIPDMENIKKEAEQLKQSIAMAATTKK